MARHARVARSQRGHRCAAQESAGRAADNPELADGGRIVARNGIVWDGLLCCDVIGVYKPDPRCYALAAEIMRVEPARIAMVASHPSDLRAARSAGWKTVFVRPHIEDPGEDYAAPGLADEFDVAVADFPDLAVRLGH